MPSLADELRDGVSPSILVVDDDERFRSRLARALRDRGLQVREAEDGDEAIALAKEDSPEYALVDLRMPGASGLSVVRSLHEIDPGTRVVVLTGYGSIATALEAIRLGAVHYLTKPADVNEIIAAFHRDAELPSVELEAEPEAPSLARVEWEHIHRVLQDVEGNISEAARRLGIHRRSLQRKLAKYPARS